MFVLRMHEALTDIEVDLRVFVFEAGGVIPLVGGYFALFAFHLAAAHVLLHDDVLAIPFGLALRAGQTVMAEAPAAFGAEQGGPGGHFRAVGDAGHFRGADQIVVVADLDVGQVFAADAVHPPQHLVHERVALGRGEVLADLGADLGFHLFHGQALVVVDLERGADFLPGLLGVGHGTGAPGPGGVFGGHASGNGAEHERAGQILLRDGRAVACREESGNRGFGVLVDQNAGVAVAGAQGDFFHALFHGVPAVVVFVALFVELAAHGAFGAPQHLFQTLEGFLGQMVELEVHGAAPFHELAPHGEEHVAGPVAVRPVFLAQGVDAVTAAGNDHIAAGRAVEVFHEQVGLEALHVHHFGACMVGHGEAVAGVSGEFVDAAEVSVARHAELADAARGDDHGGSFDLVVVPAAHVEGEDAGDFAVVVGEQAACGRAVKDGAAELADFPRESALDVLAVHGEIQGLVGGMQEAALVVSVLVQGEEVAGLAVGVPFQVLDDGQGIPAEHIGAFLVDDALGDLGQGFDHVFRGSVPGHGDDVECVHAAPDGAGCFDGALVDNDDTAVGVGFLGFDGREGARAAAAEDDDVRFNLFHAHDDPPQLEHFVAECICRPEPRVPARRLHASAAEACSIRLREHVHVADAPERRMTNSRNGTDAFPEPP